MNKSALTTRIKRLLAEMAADKLEDPPILIILPRSRRIEDAARYDPEADERPEFVKRDEVGWRKIRR